MMTDRIYAYTVLLDREIREDDAEAITAAIGMIKHVAEVVPLVHDLEAYHAEWKARNELGQKLWNVLYPKEDNP